MNTEVETNEVEFRFSDLWRVFKRFWVLIVVITIVAGGVMATIGILNQKESYSGTASFWVGGGKEGMSQSNSMAAAQMAANYMELATKDKLIRKAVQKYALNDEWSITEDEAVKYLRSMIRVDKSNEESRMFNISVVAPTEEIAYSAINALQYTMIEVVAEINGDDITTGRSDYITLVGEVQSKSDLRKYVDTGLKKAVIVALAAFVVTYMIGFFAYMYDDKIRNNDMLKSRCAYPILGTLPTFKDSKKAKPEEVVNSELQQTVSSFELMRANIDHKLIGTQNPAIAIGGADTTDIEICANLAKTVAASGKKTLIVECIPGSTAFDEIFKNDQKNGLFDFMKEDGADLSKVPVFEVSDNLYAIKAGAEIENASSTIASSSFKEMLNLAKSKYDLTVIIASPISERADIAMLCNAVSGYVLTVNKETSSFKALNHAIETLRGLDANIMGVVLGNKKTEK